MWVLKYTPLIYAGFWMAEECALTACRNPAIRAVCHQVTYDFCAPSDCVLGKMPQSVFSVAKWR